MRKFAFYGFWLTIFSLYTLSFIPYTNPVSAHAFGTLYTLPIPLWLYLYGAGAALIISFLAIGFFTRQSSHLFFPKFHLKLNHWVIFFLKVLSIFLFSLTILTGFFGSQSAYQSFAVNFFWIFFLLGFTYFSAIFGNIWDFVNPWKIILSWFGEIKPLLTYPKNLGYIPALLFYFLLIWLELLSGGIGIHPSYLSKILLFYSGLIFLGSILFGPNTWFQYGEFFSIFFGLISKLSLFGKGDLLKEQISNFSLLVFIIFMLSSTAFDGFRSTIIYFRYFFSTNSTVLLLLSPLFFLSLYMLAIFLMKILSKTTTSIKDLSIQFAYSLIPIALAYNVAHYYTLLLIQGQSIIPILSDPFNQGLNLFGTVDYQTNVGLLSASFIWHSEVAVIIIGHILAVFLAHIIALKIFSRKQAFISQIPMLLLMVCYTVTGLWILSQPLTIGG